MDRRDALNKATVTTVDAAGGLLDPEQSREFIWRLKDADDWGKNVRQVRRRASAGEINKAYTSSRIIRRATENSDDGYRAGLAFPVINYVAVKVRLPWEVTEDVYHENIEGEQLEGDVFSQMTEQFALDLSDLEWNGDTTASGGDAAFLNINDGYLKQLVDGAGSTHRLNGATINAGVLAKEHFFEARKLMPNKYRRGDLRWIASPTRVDDWQEYLAARATGAGDAILLGDERAEKPLNIPFLTIPNFPESRIVLAAPRNFCRVITWDIRRRRVTGETDKELAATDKRFYVFLMKHDAIIEELDAVVDIYGMA